jgi:hypothetical protein
MYGRLYADAGDVTGLNLFVNAQQPSDTALKHPGWESCEEPDTAAAKTGRKAGSPSSGPLLALQALLAMRSPCKREMRCSIHRPGSKFAYCTTQSCQEVVGAAKITYALQALLAERPSRNREVSRSIRLWGTNFAVVAQW